MEKSYKELINELISNIDIDLLEEIIDRLSIQWEHTYLGHYLPEQREIKMRIADMSEQVLLTGNAVEWNHMHVSLVDGKLTFNLVYPFNII